MHENFSISIKKEMDWKGHNPFLDFKNNNDISKTCYFQTKYTFVNFNSIAHRTNIRRQVAASRGRTLLGGGFFGMRDTGPQFETLEIELVIDISIKGGPPPTRGPKLSVLSDTVPLSP